MYKVRCGNCWNVFETDEYKFSKKGKGRAVMFPGDTVAGPNGQRTSSWVSNIVPCPYCKKDTRCYWPADKDVSKYDPEYEDKTMKIVILCVAIVLGVAVVLVGGVLLIYYALVIANILGLFHF